MTSPDIPWISTTEMIEVDRAMMEDFRIELIQMMENAGRNLAALARTRFLGGDPRGKDVVVLAGTGGNGGGALVAARRLHNWGAPVRVVLTRSPEDFTAVAAHQLDILVRMGVDITQKADTSQLGEPAIILDGVIGYSLKGDPRGGAAVLIEWANARREAGAALLSLDAPSGVDTTSGTVHNPAIRANATLTLALPKSGLRAEGIGAHVGELYLADISVPPGLYEQPPLEYSVGAVFAAEEIVRLA